MAKVFSPEVAWPHAPAAAMAAPYLERAKEAKAVPVRKTQGPAMLYIGPQSDARYSSAIARPDDNLERAWVSSRLSVDAGTRAIADAMANATGRANHNRRRWDSAAAVAEAGWRRR